MDVAKTNFIEVYDFTLDMQSDKVWIKKKIARLRQVGLAGFLLHLDKLRFSGQVHTPHSLASCQNNFIHRLCGEPINILYCGRFDFPSQSSTEKLVEFNKKIGSLATAATVLQSNRLLISKYKKIIIPLIQKCLDLGMSSDKIFLVLDIHQPEMKERVAELALKRTAPETVKTLKSVLALLRTIQIPRDGFVMRTLEYVVCKKNINLKKIDLREIYQREDIRDSGTYKLLEMMFVANQWERLLDNGKTIDDNIKYYYIKQPESINLLMAYLVKYKVAPLLDKGETSRGICRRYGITQSNDKCKIDNIAFAKVAALLEQNLSCREIYARLEFTACFSSYERIELMAVEKRAKRLLAAGMRYHQTRILLAISQPEALFKLADLADP